ncbi:PREDICTED: uncharacterized protein LOC109114116 [Nelumbo nucifera]|uniref:Uncharacterized protein LOC109114116 n=1 Tax=Nelumbo nucifera TaxID=4432 RepID=A0A1U8PZ28_NELNU|nr:PREDICTED: uncharacterized protein LOC109114116 [Nelumbo nucifera]
MGTESMMFPMPITPLNGLNYLEWTKGAKLYVTARGKVGYINGTVKEPKSGTAEHDRWDQENNMVMFWLLAAMESDVKRNFMWEDTANEIWEQAKTTYSKQRHFAKIYQLQAESSTCKQGNHNLSAYYSSLTSMWKELDHYQAIEWKHKDDSRAYKKLVSQQ